MTVRRLYPTIEEVVLDVIEKAVYFYQSGSGRVPFEEWLLSLDDARAKSVVRARLARLRVGSFGDCKSIGRGIYELRIFYGPGYRIYFARLSDRSLLILRAGAKDRQKQDIQEAERCWDDYRRRL